MAFSGGRLFIALAEHLMSVQRSYPCKKGSNTPEPKEVLRSGAPSLCWKEENISKEKYSMLRIRKIMKLNVMRLFFFIKSRPKLIYSKEVRLTSVTGDKRRVCYMLTPILLLLPVAHSFGHIW